MADLPSTIFSPPENTVWATNIPRSATPRAVSTPNSREGEAFACPSPVVTV
jgi:hypothetical protein